MANQARIVLLASEGLPAEVIAERVGCSRPTVVKWRTSYEQGGLAALADAPRSGARRRLAHAQADILYATLDGPPAELGVLDSIVEAGGFLVRSPHLRSLPPTGRTRRQRSR